MQSSHRSMILFEALPLSVPKTQITRLGHPKGGGYFPLENPPVINQIILRKTATTSTGPISGPITSSNSLSTAIRSKSGQINTTKSPRTTVVVKNLLGVPRKNLTHCIKTLYIRNCFCQAS